VGRKLRWLLWSGYAALWTTLLVLPSSTVELLPGRDIVGDRKYLVVKTVHVAAYAVMTILSGALQVPARWRWVLVFVLMGHGTLTEIIQKYCVSGRTGELEDVAFDNIGILIGLLLSWSWWVKKDEPENA
jgi:VanZ family protein